MRKPSGHVELDLSSFSDIAFLLIIFFILTTSLNRPVGRLLDMPSASQPAEKNTAETTPTISILEDRVMLGDGRDEGREVTLSELRAEFFSRNLAAAAETDRMVVVELAEDVSYERYLRVVAMVSEAGGIVVMLTE